MLTCERCCQFASVGLAAMMLVACSREQPIRSYTVLKDDVSASSTPSVQPASTPSAPAAASISWTLPDGWKQVGESTAMRYATLIAGEGDAAVEVSVIRLPGAAGGVDQNISRWAGQVGFQPDPQKPVRVVEPRRGKAGDYMIVDMTGSKLDEASGKPLRVLGVVMHDANDSWFIKAMGPADRIAPHKDAFVRFSDSIAFNSLPSGHPPITDPHAGIAGAPPIPSTRPVDVSQPTWTLPQGWELGPQTQFAIASFVTRSEEGPTRVTVTRLRHPSRDGAFDVDRWRLENINRWRAQVGQTPALSLEQAGIAPLAVDGLTGDLVDIAGDPNVGGSLHILGLMVQRDGSTWFIKMTGPNEAVTPQKTLFHSFVTSFKFEGSTAAADTRTQ